MNCERCKESVDKIEEREHHGQTLCEDCYMDLLSPARACDPWEIHSAQTLAKESGGSLALNKTQAKILEIVKGTGGAEPGVIVERLQIKPTDLEIGYSHLLNC